MSLVTIKASVGNWLGYNWLMCTSFAKMIRGIYPFCRERSLCLHAIIWSSLLKTTLLAWSMRSSLKLYTMYHIHVLRHLDFLPYFPKIDFEFIWPSHPFRVMSSWSVYQYLCIFFCQKLTNAFLELADGREWLRKILHDQALPVGLEHLTESPWLALKFQRGPSWPCITHLITRDVFSQLVFQFKRRRSIKIFKMAAILDLQSE